MSGAAPPAAGSAAETRRARAATRAFLVYWLAWMLLLAWVWSRHADVTHGDSYSDANVLNAARNYERCGFAHHAGLPVNEATCSPVDPARPYTHYPPGPEWLHLGLRVLGVHALGHFRLVSLAASAVALLLLVHLLTRLSGSRVLAVVAAVFYSWSLPFSQYADSLHQHAWSQLTAFGALAAWLAYEEAPTRRARAVWLTGAALVFFLDLWLTFEHILFVPIFVLGRTLLVGRRRDRLGLAVLLFTPLLVLAVRILHNSLALGGLSAAAHDLLGAATHRGGLDGSFSWTALLEVWRARLGGSDLPPGNHNAAVAYPLLNDWVFWPALTLTGLLVWGRREPATRATRRGLAGAALLLLAGGAWLVVLPNHALVHPHLIQRLLPGLALLLAILALSGFAQARGPLRRWLGRLAAVVLCGGFVAHMRVAAPLNLLVELDGPAAEAARLREAQPGMIRAAGQTYFADVRRVYFAWSYPDIAYWLDRPYVFCTLPDELAPDELAWVVRWSDTDNQFMRTALRRFGLPDSFASPHHGSLVFSAAAQPPAIDVPYAGLGHLTLLRCVRTLDGGAWLVQTLHELAPDLPPERFANAVEQLALVTAAGDVARTDEMRFSWGVRDDDRLYLWHTLDAACVPPGARLRLGLLAWDTQQPITPDHITATLPPGATWDANDTFICPPLIEP